MKQGSRLLMAFVLSIAILFIFYNFVQPPIPPQPKGVETSPTNPTSQTDQTSPTSPISPTDQTNLTTLSTSEKDLAETQAVAQQLTIETPVANIVLDTKGGVLTSYELKDYRQKASSDSPNTNLLTETPGSHALFFGVKGYSNFHEDKIFKITKDEVQGNQRVITLEWKNKDILIEKIFVFGDQKTDYAIDVDYLVTNLSDHDLNLAPYLQNDIQQKPEPTQDHSFLSFLKFKQQNSFHRLLYKDQKLTEKLTWKNFQGPELTSGSLSWSAVADRYFIFATIPGELAAPPYTAKFDLKNQKVLGAFLMPEMTLKPGGKLKGQFINYIGPKKLSEMRLLNASLEKSVDYGWFSILAVPILWLMMFFHKFIPNWGLVIIALTFVVKLLLHPINKKAMQSMKGMQQLQPKLKEIKEKLKDDKQKQNQEIMQLFRTHKINPMGGCLPMALQFPVYIVLYKVLWNSIELYHAPFFGPYKDLSGPDPYFILPILLGVFMFLQQKLTPSPTADSAQQKMMYFMPIMFTGFMLFLPVGLVVYIFVNTVMSVIQQFMIKREISFKDFITGKWKPEPNGA